MNGSRFSLDGKTALVTGGAKGIGAAICTEFAQAGAKVFIADRDVEVGQALAKKIEGE